MNIRNLIVILSLTFMALQGSSVMAEPAGKSVVDLQYLSDNSQVPGASSKLVRTKHGVSMTLSTSDLPAGAYTNWWMVFNNPELCTHPLPEIGLACSPPDFATPEVAGSVLFATGNVVGESGKGNFAANLKAGDTDGADFGPGLLYPRGAEIHIVVRYHGEVIPEMMPAQIMTFGGACLINECANLQGAAHSPW